MGQIFALALSIINAMERSVVLNISIIIKRYLLQPEVIAAIHLLEVPVYLLQHLDIFSREEEANTKEYRLWQEMHPFLPDESQ